MTSENLSALRVKGFYDSYSEQFHRLYSFATQAAISFYFAKSMIKVKAN